MKRLTYILPFVLSLFLLNACSDRDYLMQSIMGQWSLMSRTQPIDDILEQNSEPQNIRDQLIKVVELREFAVSALNLPDTGSYREYADLERPYVVWNLVVAPELSLKLNHWCFPVAGCVTYRGYFDEVSATSLAHKYSMQGFDVDVYGVQAYSTLNWFDDPVLNTFLTNDELRLAALLFHEMAHQVIYVPNDTAFNESFAKTVEMEGLRRWLQGSDSHDLWAQCLQREDQSTDFYNFLAEIRANLGQVYDSKLDNHQKRLAKQEILSHAFDEYEHLKKRWNGYAGFDSWMQGGLNNARLSSMAAYNDLVPAFQMLLRQVDNDLQKFYSEVKMLGKLPVDDRHAKLKSLTQIARHPPVIKAVYN
jgi:predicted aminopeptidase